MFRVVILGHGDMLGNLIAGTLDAGCEIVGVLRYEKVKSNPIVRWLKDFFVPTNSYNYIKSYNLHEIKAKSANSEQFKNEILKLNPDIIFVGTWSEKLKKDIINLPKIAMINVHPSLLPKYRGPNPYLQTIKHGEEKSGVTFHLIDENYDTGAILMQKTVDILPEDTGKELKARTVIAARGAVYELLQNLNEDLIIPLIQSEKNASYFPQIKNDEVMLNFEQSSVDVYRHIRAFYPWVNCYFNHNNSFFIPNPYKTEILDNNTDIKERGRIVDKDTLKASITVTCGDGKLLKMSGLRLYGRFKKMFSRLYIKYCVKISDRVY